LDTAKGTVSDAFSNMRDQAVAAMEPRLADAKAQVAKFRDKLAALPETARPTVDSAIAEVEKQMTAVGEQLTKLKAAGSDSWQSISTELGAAMDKVGTAIKDLAAKFPS